MWQCRPQLHGWNLPGSLFLLLHPSIHRGTSCGPGCSHHLLYYPHLLLTLRSSSSWGPVGVWDYEGAFLAFYPQGQITRDYLSLRETFYAYFSFQEWPTHTPSPGTVLNTSLSIKHQFLRTVSPSLARCCSQGRHSAEIRKKTSVFIRLDAMRKLQLC